MSKRNRKKCVACGGRTSSHYFMFPSDSKRRAKWKTALGLGYTYKSSSVCEYHFAPRDFMLPLGGTRERRVRLRYDAIPKPLSTSVRAFGKDLHQELSSQSRDDRENTRCINENTAASLNCSESGSSKFSTVADKTIVKTEILPDMKFEIEDEFNDNGTAEPYQPSGQIGELDRTHDGEAVSLSSEVADEFTQSSETVKELRVVINSVPDAAGSNEYEVQRTDYRQRGCSNQQANKVITKTKTGADDKAPLNAKRIQVKRILVPLAKLKQMKARSMHRGSGATVRPLEMAKTNDHNYSQATSSSEDISTGAKTLQHGKSGHPRNDIFHVTLPSGRKLSVKPVKLRSSKNRVAASVLDRGSHTGLFPHGSRGIPLVILKDLFEEVKSNSQSGDKDILENPVLNRSVSFAQSGGTVVPHDHILSNVSDFNEEHEKVKGKTSTRGMYNIKYQPLLPHVLQDCKERTAKVQNKMMCITVLKDAHEQRQVPRQSTNACIVNDPNLSVNTELQPATKVPRQVLALANDTDARKNNRSDTVLPSVAVASHLLPHLKKNANAAGMNRDKDDDSDLVVTSPHQLPSVKMSAGSNIKYQPLLPHVLQDYKERTAKVQNKVVRTTVLKDAHGQRQVPRQSTNACNVNDPNISVNTELQPATKVSRQVLALANDTDVPKDNRSNTVLGSVTVAPHLLPHLKKNANAAGMNRDKDANSDLVVTSPHQLPSVKMRAGTCQQKSKNAAPESTANAFNHPTATTMDFDDDVIASGNAILKSVAEITHETSSVDGHSTSTVDDLHESTASESLILTAKMHQFDLSADSVYSFAKSVGGSYIKLLSQEAALLQLERKMQYLVSKGDKGSLENQDLPDAKNGALVVLREPPSAYDAPQLNPPTPLLPAHMVTVQNPQQMWQALAKLRMQVLQLETKVIRSRIQTKFDEVVHREERNQLKMDLKSKTKEMQREVDKKDQRIQVLEGQLQAAQQKEESQAKLKNNLRKIFTSHQLKLLESRDLSKINNVRWPEEDLRRAIEMRRVITRPVYRYLQDVMHIPLPPPERLRLGAQRYQALRKPYAELVEFNRRKFCTKKKSNITLEKAPRKSASFQYRVNADESAPLPRASHNSVSHPSVCVQRARDDRTSPHERPRKRPADDQMFHSRPRGAQARRRGTFGAGRGVAHRPRTPPVAAAGANHMGRPTAGSYRWHSNSVAAAPVSDNSGSLGASRPTSAQAWDSWDLLVEQPRSHIRAPAHRHSIAGSSTPMSLNKRARTEL